MRSYWKSVKTINTIRFKESDKRPYAEVRLLGMIIIGFLDIGAVTSVIDGSLAKQIIQSKHSLKLVATAACTADSKRQEVVGRFCTPVQYKGVVKDLDLNIIPSLSQDLYLGIDFWSRFGVLPSAMEISEIASDSHELSC